MYEHGATFQRAPGGRVGGEFSEKLLCLVLIYLEVLLLLKTFNVKLGKTVISSSLKCLKQPVPSFNLLVKRVFDAQN